VAAPAVGEGIDGDRTHRRRTTGLLAALAVVIVAGLGFIVWALLDEPADPGGAQGGPTASSSAAPATTPSPSDSEPTTSSTEASSPSTSAPETTTTSSTAPGARGAELARAVRDYYALLPDDTDAGWARLTARYQATTSRDRETYEEFWGSVDAVAVPRSEGTAPDRVVATIRYDFDDGRRFEERTSFRLVDVGGVLKIDGSSVLSSRQL
jgi:cytoskeletal protein RodZ